MRARASRSAVSAEATLGALSSGFTAAAGRFRAAAGDWLSSLSRLSRQVPSVRSRLPASPRRTSAFLTPAAAVGVVVALAVAVSLAFAVAPSGRRAPAGQKTPQAGHRASASPTPSAAALSAVARIAVGALEQRTGLPYRPSGCKSSCLTAAHESDGVQAAVVRVNAGSSQACAAYLVQQGGRWQVANATCAAPGRLSPLPGQPTQVTASAGVCVNVRTSPGFNSTVVTCLYSGTPVTVDSPPSYSGGLLWWHIRGRGWMAQQFLAGA
jgi:hypothetical protein